MKRLLLLALFAATAASAKAPAERWLDPECFEVGRAPMRTSFIAFPTAAEAIPENDYTRSPFYRTLNGEWSFLRVDRPGAEPEGFFRSGHDDSSWGTMPVPGIWELNGCGDPVYTNKPYPWHKFFEVKPPLIPHEQNYTGLYRRTVTVPADWKGRDIFIHIGSATSNVTLWVNGPRSGLQRRQQTRSRIRHHPLPDAGQRQPDRDARQPLVRRFVPRRPGLLAAFGHRPRLLPLCP